MKTKVFFSLLLGMCFLTFSHAFSQEQNPSPTQKDSQSDVKADYSDEQLKTFIDANKKMVEIQQESEQEMMKAIESEDIAVDKFNEILMARQNPDQKTEATPEELEAFGKAAQKVMDIQKDLQTKAEKAVEEQGLQFEEYQQMMQAYQQDQDLQQRVAQLIGNQPEEQENK